ncbi:MAG: DUF2089 domain-containing protein [Chloroflexi bacterium]|nr:DUF2089 domain-containing protein [Chloroflexota bacterium]MBL7164386.1 DUF2089 domain-containing protein [Anaerolineales bacterium]
MQTLPTQCPICNGEITVTKIYCRDCDTTLEGRFTFGAFAQLTPKQLEFVETFIRCEGKITRMEAELKLSYPTIRNRLRAIIKAMGYEPELDEETGLTEKERRQVLEDLDAGVISYEDAIQLLGDQEE